ncbi:MAG: SUF system NifU family Fe-S cluster assembly protein [Woeseiaceae bacterium]|nr:SUF system NifU family Fe-S cluster assembly protein [Woeseiaceae bacterium]
MSGAGDSEIRELYRSTILDHARTPRRFGRMKNPTHTAQGINSLCGDKLEIYLTVQADKIVDVSFDGTGCAISLASASMMSDRVIGQSIIEAMSDIELVGDSLNGSSSATLPGSLEALKGVREYPSRVKCATLAWHALGAAIESDGSVATTE